MEKPWGKIMEKIMGKRFMGKKGIMEKKKWKKLWGKNNRKEKSVGK